MYAKVFRSLWDGSLADCWEAWALFVFMLAHADSDGCVDMAPGAMARRSGLPADVVDRGLKVLLAPDPMSRNAAEGGRRLVPMDGRPCGWQVVNYRLFRGMVSAEVVREQTRERVRRFRERQVRPPVTVTPRNAQKRQVEVEVEGEGEGEGEAGEPTPQQATGNAGTAPTLPLEPTSGPEDGPEGGQATPGTNGAQHGPPALPVKDGPEWVPKASMVDECRLLYPGLDVDQQLRNMRGWLLSHPTRRPTRKGAPGFVHGWLKREQRGGAPGRRPGPRSESDMRYARRNAAAIAGRDQ